MPNPSTSASASVSLYSERARLGLPMAMTVAFAFLEVLRPDSSLLMQEWEDCEFSRQRRDITLSSTFSWPGKPIIRGKHSMINSNIVLSL